MLDVLLAAGATLVRPATLGRAPAGRGESAPRARPAAQSRRDPGDTAQDPGTRRSPGRRAALVAAELRRCPVSPAGVLRWSWPLLPFATAPGDIIADTKFELAVNPAGFLSGALTLWNPQQFGGLLNQAVGYLFPMGPFFELLKLLARRRLDSPAAVARRACCSPRSAARSGSPRGWASARRGTRLAAGLAYALSPAALSMIGQTSGEFLPMAMMPWIIVPLTDMRPVGAAAPGPGRAPPAGHRAVARSAVAVALCSGMNAASTARRPAARASSTS